MILDDDQEVWLDAFNLFVGEQIGVGMTRRVFVLRSDPTVVVKIEKGPRQHFQNIMEWHIWSRVAGTSLEKWFAPVIRMSSEGRVLLMKRTEPARRADLPERVPAWMTDLKMANFGVLNGKLVLHDYAKTMFIERGMTKATVKADWRDDES